MIAKRSEEALEKIQGSIDELIEQYSGFREGGFQVHEIIKFTFQAGTRLINVVERLGGVTGPEKKEIVMASVMKIYQEVNPDIPWIPEPFESWVEDFVLEKTLSVFIDFYIRARKERQ